MADVSAEHLKHTSYRLCPLLVSMCFTGFLFHGVLPDSSTSAVLVPVIKNKSAKWNNCEYYRPIALPRIISNVLESLLYTTDNQHRCSRSWGSTVSAKCLWTLKDNSFFLFSVWVGWKSQNTLLQRHWLTLLWAAKDTHLLREEICHPPLTSKACVYCNKHRGLLLM